MQKAAPSVSWNLAFSVPEGQHTEVRDQTADYY